MNGLCRLLALLVFTATLHAEEAKMITRSFKVLPAFLPKADLESQSSSDPFAPRPVENKTLKQSLEDAGITFPEGSSVSRGSLGEIVCRNTEQNLERLKKHIDSLNAANAEAQLVEKPKLHTRTFKVPPDFLFTSLHGPDAPPLPPHPIGLPLERPWPSSSKLILEAQGVIFPEGASANFNPLTGLLTVTNTQPNLDLVAAFTEVLRKDAPASLAHQLIILEGPGELIRTANAAASRTADARKELETLLDHARNPGSNIRVVADAFMEGRSGVHSTTCAVREHVHATGLDLDSQSRATTAWDMRPLGLSLEIELSMGADGRTLDSNLIVKFHPLTPSIRQITLTEPLTGQPAEFPLSNTAGAEFTTAITSTAGATKLIGVTKPVGLADQKADVLWAAFLTSTLRHVEMLPPPPRPKANSGSVPAGMESTTFSAPEGLFDKLMEQETQPVRQWLENIQGITFPPGAVLEQRDENLHVINTPAMIEAIGAVVAHAQNTAPHTLAFTLHTLQAPAGLLRDLTRKSVAASGDDTSMLAAVEAAVQRGEAEFIDTLYLESKSGCRSTYQSAREHSHLSGFQINAKNQPEVEFDMRAVGSSLEIEPYLRADGQTVALRLSHELHSAPPETRAAHFRDPASGKPFAMPVTDFHVLRTSTSFEMIRGGTKLISLHQPTGRDSEGKLWATFLKCDAVPQVVKHRLVVPENANRPRAVKRHPGEQFTRSLRVNQEALHSLMYADGNLKKSAKQVFEEAGVAFPDEASVSYGPATTQILVRNTSENLDKVELFLAKLEDLHQPKTLVFTTHILQAPGPLLRRIASQAAGKRSHHAELDELLAAVKTGGVQSLGTARIETKSGTRGTTLQGTQHNALAEVGINKAGDPEIFTESRHVGLKVELDPTVVADGRTVELTLDPEFHTAAPFEHRERILDTQGRKLEFPLTDYHSAKVTTAITMPSGTARLLSLYKPTGKPEFEKEDILQAIFITCDILRVGE
ncbi:MAG: hypothetical protein Q8M07_13755 [Prosthecobacter sp.]|nr:hypothetical protein [Prosthecobacter sp.]